MPDLTYLISMCPPQLRPTVGDPVDVRFEKSDDGRGRATHMWFHSSKKLSCVRVSAPTGEVRSGQFMLLDSEEACGNVSGVRVMRRMPEDIAVMSIQMQQFVADGRMPEDILVTVRVHQSVTEE